MKILLIVHHFFPDKHAYAGTERYILLLAKQLQRMGHDVTVLTYSMEDSNAIPWTTHGDCMYREYSYQGVPVVSVRHVDVPIDVSFSINNVAVEDVLMARVFSKQYDVAHVAHPLRLGSAVKMAKSRGIPVVLMLCDFWLLCPMGILLKGDMLCNGPGGRMTEKCAESCYQGVSSKKLAKRYEEAKELFYSAAAVTSRSRFLRDVFFENGWKREIIIDTLGVDYSVLKGDIEKRYDGASTVTFGFIGTVQRHKGAQVAIDAFKKVSLPNVRLEIWGGGHGDGFYENLRKLAGGDSRISFKGKYDYEDIHGLLEGIDVGVVPSIWWENAPQVLLALQANRVPAIVSRLGGMTELVRDGVDGFHFEPGDSGGLSSIMEKIGKDPSLLNGLRRNVRMTARFEEEAFEYEKIYKRVVRKT